MNGQDVLPLKPGNGATMEVDHDKPWDDERPCCRLEEVLMSVPAPGPSLRRPFGTTKFEKTRVDAKDCQWWTKESVRELLKQGIVGAYVVEMVEKLPKH